MEPGPWLSVITGLDWWTGQLDWTTGLTFDLRLVPKIVKAKYLCVARTGCTLRLKKLHVATGMLFTVAMLCAYSYARNS